MAWSPSLLGAGTVLMGAHDRAVDYRILVVGIGSEVLEHTLPHTRLGPTAEPPMHANTITKALREIAPRQTCTITVEHRLDKQPVVLRRRSHMARPPRQKVLNPLPLIVPEAVASHQSAPSWLTAYESKLPLRRNPLNDDTP